MSHLRRALALALLFPAAACVHEPRAFDPTRVPTPEPPPLAVEPDAQTLGWARAHQVHRVLTRVGAGTVIDRAAQAGFDLAGLDPERPFVVVAGVPPGTGEAPNLPAQLFLPVQASSPIGAAAAILGGLGATTTTDTGMIVALNGAPSTSRTLDQLVAAPMSGDVEVVVNVEAAAARWQAEIERGFETVRDEMRQGPSELRASAAAFDVYVKVLRDALATIRTLTLGFEAGEKDLLLEAVSRHKGPAAASKEVLGMPDLGRFVAPADMRFEWSGTGWASLTDFYVAYYAALLPKRPDLVARFERLFRTWSEGQTFMAGGFTMGGEGGLIRGSAVIQSDRAEAQYAAMLEGVELTREPDVQALMRYSGASAELKLERKIREIKDFPVDRLTYAIHFDEAKLGPEAVQALRPFMQPIVVEIVRAGPFIATTFGQPGEALDRLVAELDEGKGSHPSLTARGQHPAGGTMYWDLDLGGLLAHMEALLPPGTPSPWPRLVAGIGPVTLYGRSVDPVSHYRLRVPMSLVNALRGL